MFRLGSFKLWAVLFMFARFSVVTLTVLVVWFGLSKLENKGLDVKAGNFNTPLIRYVVAMSGMNTFSEMSCPWTLKATSFQSLVKE